MAKKTGLLISGGGSKTAWMAGTLGALAEIHEFIADVIICGSGSTVSAAHYLYRDIKSLEMAWKEGKVADKNFISYKRMPWNWVDLDYLLYDICGKQIPFNEQAYLESATKLFIAATNRNTGEVEYFEKPHPDNLPEVCKASCAIPGLKWGGVGINGEIYCDTYISSSPFFHKKKAKQEGIERNIIISPGKHNKITTRLEKYWVKTMPKEFQKRYYEQQEEARSLENNMGNEEMLIIPKTPLIIDTFSRDAEEMKEAYLQGYSEVASDKNLIEFLKE
ncbi:MAG: patatin-like phospholipase family protein [archaeon]